LNREGRIGENKGVSKSQKVRKEPRPQRGLRPARKTDGSKPCTLAQTAHFILEDKQENDTPDRNKLKYVRDFVSHIKCDSKKTVDFINTELPSAKTDNGVCYDRLNSEHIYYVWKYANLAVQEAKKVLNAHIEKCGGYVG
jgi:hypothetical protein